MSRQNLWVSAIFRHAIFRKKNLKTFFFGEILQPQRRIKRTKIEGYNVKGKLDIYGHYFLCYVLTSALPNK